MNDNQKTFDTKSSKEDVCACVNVSRIPQMDMVHDGVRAKVQACATTP